MNKESAHDHPIVTAVNRALREGEEARKALERHKRLNRERQARFQEKHKKT